MDRRKEQGGQILTGDFNSLGLTLGLKSPRVRFYKGGQILTGDFNPLGLKSPRVRF
jgi:hypothetical protein